MVLHGGGASPMWCFAVVVIGSASWLCGGGCALQLVGVRLWVFVCGVSRFCGKLVFLQN